MSIKVIINNFSPPLCQCDPESFSPCLHGVRAYRLGIDNTIMSELASYFTSSRR